MNVESCINTVEMLRRLALNVHGVIDAVDDENCNDIIELLQDNELKINGLASIASLSNQRAERAEKVLYDLRELGYPHNFQHEASWVVDYLYKLTPIITRAFELKRQ